MEALSSVSSWCVPFSISSLAASSGEGAPSSSRPFGFFEEKPSFCGGMERRRRSTESMARSERTLTVLMMSSRRALRFAGVSDAGVKEGNSDTYDGRIAEMLRQELIVGSRGCRHVGLRGIDGDELLRPDATRRVSASRVDATDRPVTLPRGLPCRLAVKPELLLADKNARSVGSRKRVERSQRESMQRQA